MRKTYGTQTGPGNYDKMLDNSYRQTVEAEQQRTVDAKIARLRQRLRDMPIDANVRAIILGVLDLLADEL